MTVTADGTEHRQPSATAGQTAARAGSSEEITPTDPCAMRLHDISGPMLLYYAMHRRLPERLEELQAVPGAEPGLTFVCPVSGRPYVYASQGVSVPNLKGTVVLYDAEPSHAGHHWAIAIAPPVEGQPLLTRVVAVAPGQLPRAGR